MRSFYGACAHNAHAIILNPYFLINVKLTKSAIDSQEDPLPREKNSFQYSVFLIAFQIVRSSNDFLRYCFNEHLRFIYTLY